jgi:hypothetical protein
MENNTISISIERFEQLVAKEARCTVLESYVINNRYSPDRNMVAGIIGFEIPADKKDE